MKKNHIKLTLALSVCFVPFANAHDSKAEQFLDKCGQIVSDMARLTCYDELNIGNTPTTLAEKRPVDLGETLKSTVEGKPQVVFLATGDAVKSTNLSKQTEPKSPNQTPVVAKLHQTPPTNAHDNLNNPVQKTSTKTLKERLDSLFGRGGDTFSDNLESSTQGAVLTEINTPKEQLQKYTPLSLAFDLDKNSERGLWSARPHNPNYLLPYYYNMTPNYVPTSPSLGGTNYNEDELRKIEVKYQVSLKTKAAQNLFGTDADLWIGYTQQSHWQTYNENHSRHFRSHDYQPEVFLTQPVVADLFKQGKLRMLGAGFVHHSNGESDPISRSWNRIYIVAGAEWGNLTVVPTAWIALPKREGSKGSDNPDITDYYGYGDVKFLYRLDDNRTMSGTLRLSPNTGKGAIQLDYVHPIGRGVSSYVQLFHGYGQNLVDYNHEATSLGIGVMLTDWLGL